MKRDLGKADEIFDVPAINFFTSGNDYFGSSGSKFRYRISHTDENIVGEVWVYLLSLIIYRCRQRTGILSHGKISFHFFASTGIQSPP